MSILREMEQYFIAHPSKVGDHIDTYPSQVIAKAILMKENPNSFTQSEREDFSRVFRYVPHSPSLKKRLQLPKEYAQVFATETFENMED